MGADPPFPAYSDDPCGRSSLEISGVRPASQSPWLEQEPRLEHAMGGEDEAGQYSGDTHGRWQHQAPAVVVAPGHGAMVADGGCCGLAAAGCVPCHGLALAAPASQVLVLAVGSSNQMQLVAAAAVASSGDG